jgi:hypothetical protein
MKPFSALIRLVWLLVLPFSAPAQTAFHASLQTASSGDLVIRWPGQADQRYRVESSPDLQSWTALPTIFAGSGGDLETIVRAAGTGDPARQFWRVVTIDPNALVATGSDGKVALTWGEVAGATTYNIKRGPHGGPYVLIGTSTVPYFDDTSLTNGTTYFYVVSAVTGAGEGTNLAEAAAQPVATPTIGVVSLTTTGAIHVTWAPCAGATSFVVKFSPVAGSAAAGTVGGSVAAPTLGSDVAGPLAGTRVYLSVVATNSVGGGASASSPERFGTPLAPFAIATLASGHADGMTVTWSSAAATSYDLLYGASGATATTTLPNCASGVTVPGLTAATSYDFQVRANNETGSITTDLRTALTRANVGIGIPGPSYYDQLHWMVDMVATGDFRKSGTWSGAALDADGWPTEDFRIILVEGNEPAGDYAIRFSGSATDLKLDSGGTGTVTALQYDAASNTTTALLRMTTPMRGLTSIVFTGTRRLATDAAGTGVTKLRIFRPGYPTDGSAVFTTEFLAALQRFQVIRSMDYVATNQNPTQEWSERPLMRWGGFGGASGTYVGTPHYIQFDGSWYPRGAPWERFVQLANTAGVDVWINVPCRASDSYITNLANLLRYGSDGVNPYTAPTANPVYPPLNPGLRIYLEYGNEVWNFAGGFMNYRWVQALAKDIHDNVPGHPINFDGRLATDNQWYTLSMERYSAYRSAAISARFREVFGDAAMFSRIRPVFTYQAGGGIASGLQWAAAYFGTTQPARAVNEIWYGAGGAAYYDSDIASTSTAPEVMTGYFAHLPNSQFAKQTSGDALWAKTYDLKLVAYEGGPGPGGTATGGISGSERIISAFNADPRMHDAMLRAQRIWDSYEGDLLVYYSLAGSGPWAFGNSVSTVFPVDTVKLQAIDTINATLRAPVTTAATLVPGLVLVAPENPAVTVSGGYWSGPGAYAIKPPSEGTGSLLFPIRTAVAGNYLLAVRGSGNTAIAKLQISVNGRLLSTSVLLPTSKDAPSSPAIPAFLPAGLCYVRIDSAIDSTVAAYVSGLVVTAADPAIPSPGVPPAPTGLVATAPNSTTATLTWTAAGDSVSYYNILRGTSTSVTPYRVSLAPAFTDQGLTAGTNYYYAVQAVNAAGTSANSALAQVQPLAVPGGVTLVPSGADTLVVSWTAVPTATDYAVTYSTEKGNSGNGTTVTVPAGALTATIGGLTTGERYYVTVVARNAVGGGAVTSSAEASAIAGGSAVPPTPPIPAPTGVASVGINIPHPTYWDELHWFVDLARGGGDFRRLDWSTASMDPTDGYPLEDFILILSGSPEATGTYKIRFQGQASISPAANSGTLTLANTFYDSATNTTTADLVVTQQLGGLSWLTFRDTRRTAAAATGTGVTALHVFRPGYPTDGSVVYTTEFIAAARKFSVLRTMDFGDTNSNPVREWSERDLVRWPGFSGAGGRNERNPHGIVYNGEVFTRGGPWELMIQLANAAGVDLWLNIPCRASDDYMRKLALLMRYGSDGVEPYTSVQANPAYPPLNPDRRIYLEYGNEIWNTAGGFMCHEWASEGSEVARLAPYHPINYDGMASTDSGLALVRYTAYRSAMLSFAFRAVFGDAAMMTRVRPILSSWAGDGGGTLSTALRWAEGYFAPDYVPREIWYGAGGAAYYDSSAEPSSADAAVVTAYFAGLPTTAFAQQTDRDALWTRLYGLKLISYEGGPSVGGTATGGIGVNATLAEFYSADPRMKDRMVAAHEIWDSYGGDILVYYTLGGTGPWGFGSSTSTTSPTNTTKLQAIDTIRGMPATTVADAGTTLATSGTTSVATVTGNPAVVAGGAYWTGTGGLYSLRPASGAGSAYNTGSLLFTVKTAAAGDYDITLTTVAPATTLSLRVNDVTTNAAGAPATLTLATTGSAPTVSAPVRMHLPAGLSSIRLQVIEPSTQNANLYSVNFTPVAP